MPSITIQQFESFIPYIEDLRQYSDRFWEQPIAPGKWSLKELVCHLWHWDRYSLTVMVPQMDQGAILPAFVDIEEHNNEARVLSRSFANPAELVDDFVRTRRELIERIAAKYDSQVRFTIGGGKRKYSYDSYVEIFTHHDEQHRGQIEQLKASAADTEA